jgi:(p)ppGpp synthase/HD superfamily hydrolase
MLSASETTGSLEHALRVASEAHKGQVDKAGEPYILHPLRVMNSVAGGEEKIVALLHDVVEKSPEWTLNRLLNEGFSQRVVRGVDALTRRPNESYADFALRAAADPISRTVKLADLTDNIQMTQGPTPTEEEEARAEKYRRAFELIKAQPKQNKN